MEQLTFEDARRQHLRVPDNRRPKGLADDVRMRWVPGYEGLYAVSEGGRIFGYQKPGGADSLRQRPKELNPREDRYGYMRTDLTKGGKRTPLRVHRLVMWAFGDDPPSADHECSHQDGDPKNNHISNLEWETHVENIRTGAGHTGSHVKLTCSDARQIRRLYDDGSAVGDLAEMFDVSASAIRKVLVGDNFSDVGGPTIEKSDFRRLDAKDAQEIRQLYDSGDYTYKQIAKRFDVSAAHVGKVVRGKSFADAGGPISEGNAGEQHPDSALTNNQARQAREIYDSRDITIEELSEMFGISRSTMASVTRGETYRDAGGPTNFTPPSGHKPGEDHPQAKLTKEEVIEIRRRYEQTDMSYDDLGQKYGVSGAHIGRIVKHEIWRHLD